MKLGNPSKEEEYILTLEEKKKTFIPKSVVSKSVYDKLTSLDIKTVGDVLARGHVEMEALTNTATVSKIDAFMRTMGLSLFPRIRDELTLISWTGLTICHSHRLNGDCVPSRRAYPAKFFMVLG